MSHYIPVGKLKIDKEILDYACPAAGYDKTPPPPEIYCPVNGYIPDPTIYMPPVILPESSLESIIFICNGYYGDWDSDSASVNILGAVRKFEVFDNTALLIHTYVGADLFTYTFPSEDYYSVKISPSTELGTITRMNTSRSSSKLGLVIESAIFNTPNITSLNKAFYYEFNFKSVEFKSSLLLLENMEYTFAYSGLITFKFQDNYPALTTLNSVMLGAKFVNKIIFPRNCNLPILTTLTNAFNSCSGCVEIVFPENLPEVTLITGLCSSATMLQNATLWLTAPKLFSGSSMFNGCDLRGTLIVPEMQMVTSLQSFLLNNNSLKKLVFTGNMDGLSGFQNMVYNCLNLEELEYPRTGGPSNYSPFYKNDKLKILRVQDLITFPNGVIFIPITPVLERVYGEADNSIVSDGQTLSLTFSAPKLKIIDLPKLRLNSLVIGGTSLPQKLTYLETLNIDWTNSPFSSAAATTVFINAPFNSAWINNMFSLLPTVVGKKIDIRLCDGYATCDKTIATAKGWTVL